MKFAPFIRDARQRALLTQEDLAAALGLSARAVWLAEQGAGTRKTLTPVLQNLQIPIVGLPPGRDLGARLRAARRKKGWSLQVLAEKCGLSIPTLRARERGSGRITSLEAAIHALAPSARVQQPKRVRREAPRIVTAPTIQSFINADCIDAMRTMESGSVDLVVTSPPYNAGKEYETDLSVEEYIQFAEHWIAHIPRLLTPTGALWLNVGHIKPSETEAVPLTYLYYPLLVKHGLHVVQEVVWHFEGGLNYSRRFSHRTERWMWCVKDPTNYTFHLDDVRDHTLNVTADNRNHHAGKNPTDYWRFERVVGGRGSSSEKTAHPCQFPVAMVERIVRACSSPGDVVLDCFGGSGTTAAAYENGRGFISIEIDQQYDDIARDRLHKLRPASQTMQNPKMTRAKLVA
jgi:adenine-specific DNA-methyltransferase